MGDSRRNLLMSTLIAKQFPKAKKALVIADGQGDLANRLANKGLHCIVIEKHARQDHARKNVDYRKGIFSYDMDRFDVDLIVGMHPDEATSEIIRYAMKHKIPFAVCPCCIKGIDSAGVHGYRNWLTKLKSLAKGFNVSTLQLKMTGKNIVIVGKP